MAVEIEPDFAAMSMEEMDAWIEAEEAKIPFTSFDFGTDAGRQGLLRKYYMIGDTSLFEAVSHIWASLAKSGLMHRHRDRCWVCRKREKRVGRRASAVSRGSTENAQRHTCA